MTDMPHEITIPPGNPFDNDQLGRAESGEVLMNFVTSLKRSSVICIDAPWGQGKTTFLLMWRQLLEDANIPVLYFNAWENDFSQDALVALIGEIGTKLDALSASGNKSAANEYLEKAKKYGVALLKRSIPVAAKLATAGALDLDKLSEQALGGLAEAIVKEEIEKYEAAKTSMDAFRASLEALAATFSDGESPKPLVFIIDELDRCRPSFAIEVLEKAKHLFNVPNIVFVLGLDKRQLGHSIRGIYGAGLDVSGYLRRFIDFDYLLPPPEKGDFAKALFKRFGLNEYFRTKNGRETRYEQEQALTMFSELFEAYDLSLREQVHCCSLLDVAIKTTPQNMMLHPIFLCLLIVLKVKSPDVYANYVQQQMGPAELLGWLKESSKMRAVLETNYGTALEAHIAMSASDRYFDEDEVAKPYLDVVNSESAPESERYRAKRIVDIIGQFRWGSAGVLGYLVKKIEIASRFRS
ncbi:MAG: P-loop NTPase fold protein [Pseudomonadota bacterium]|nr:P-loop NTPase fold protein [Pseudomonadota bacterium]